MTETMRWDSNRLMLGDDELARLEGGSSSARARFVMTCFNGAKGEVGQRRGLPDAKALARDEIIVRIRQGRDALLTRAREDAALAYRIVNAEFPEPDTAAPTDAP